MEGSSKGDPGDFRVVHIGPVDGGPTNGRRGRVAIFKPDPDLERYMQQERDMAEHIRTLNESIRRQGLGGERHDRAAR